MPGPMLAATIKDLHALRYPLLASLKLDGIRATIWDGRAYTRAMKPIPNLYVRDKLESLGLPLDGELAVCDILEGQQVVNFRATTSAIMTRTGTPTFHYFVFDHVGKTDIPYYERMEVLEELRPHLPEWVTILKQTQVLNADTVLEMFEDARRLDHEGLILRSHTARYKQGRSTLREQGLLKMKPWKDDEAVILDMIEEMENLNEQITDERGYAKRSSHQENKIPKGTMGALVCKSQLFAQSFEIGTGFTSADRKDFWERKAELIGQTVTYKFVDAGGYDKPRHASFKGFRHKDDL